MGMGILIRMLIGISMALGVALYINKGANPFLPKSETDRSATKSTTALPEPRQGSRPPNGTRDTLKTERGQTALRFLQDIAGY